MSNLQKKLQSLIDSAVAEGRERGMQVAVYHNGKLIVDIWAGYMDPEKSRKMTGDTLVPIFSVTKGVVATMAHIAVERGLITYDTPVAKVWPEFAANGKGNILFRHVLSHTAGMQMMATGVVPEDLLDWDKMCRQLAEATPVAPPGTTQVYHGVTYGFLVGEILRRVDGRNIQQILREDICTPLGIRDMYIGLPKELDDRVAILEHPEAPAPPEDDIPREVAKCMWPLHYWMNQEFARRAVVPGSSGIMTARAIARHYAAILPGGVDGVQLISEKTLKTAIVAEPFNNVKRFGLGWGVGDAGPGVLQFGHGGFGGSSGQAIPAYGIAWGVAKNLFSSRAVEGEVFATIKSELGVPMPEAVK